MCRYVMHFYKRHFACFDCRKMFRWPQDAKHEPAMPVGGFVVPCPECRKPMANVGMDFKAPAKRNVKQWEKVRILYAKGIRWTSCGCTGPGHNFRTLQDAKEYVPGTRPPASYPMSAGQA